MFTGIIVGMGRVVKRTEINDGVRLVIEPPDTFPNLGDGASIAVNGVCLTAIPVLGDADTADAAAADKATAAAAFHFDAVGATLEKTRLGHLNPGDHVNLEAGLRAGDPLDGHIVTGHVDGLGTVLSLREAEGAIYMEVEAPQELAKHLAPRGSITMDGVSLTLAETDHNKFIVSLIPFTLEVTTLGALKVGDKVHLETDVLAKYVVSALENTAVTLEGM